MSVYLNKDVIGESPLSNFGYTFLTAMSDMEEIKFSNFFYTAGVFKVLGTT